MNLKRLRQQIDKIDRNILRLLNRRLKLAQQIGQAKRVARKPIFDPAREALLLKQLHCENKGLLSQKALSDIYREILSESRLVQKKLAFNRAITKKQKKGAFGSEKRML